MFNWSFTLAALVALVTLDSRLLGALWWQCNAPRGDSLSIPFAPG